MKQATLTGLVAGLALAAVISFLAPYTWIAGLLGWAVGIFGSLIGFGIVTTWRWVTRLLG